ncbi:MAG: 3D domain-containing protein [Clostridium sp.]|nr:3D domain-containing protein [Clostridium sp.]
MNKKSTVLSVLLSTTICFTNIIGSFSAYADNLDAERQAISDSKAQYDLLGEQILSLNSEIANINIEIDKLNAKLKDNEAQIANTEIEIGSTKYLLEQTEEKIKEKEDLLSKRLRNMQKSGNLTSNMLVYLISSESLNDVFDKLDAVIRIVALDKDLINEVKEQKEALTETIKELSNKEASLQALKEETKLSLEELKSKKSEQETKIAQLNEEKSKASATIESNERKLIAHSVSTIENSNSVDELQKAISTLTYLIPTLNSSSVIAAANDSIYQGNLKVEEINAAIKAQASVASRGDSNNASTPGESSGHTALSTLTMESTAYTGGTLTATGTKPVYNPGGISTIAVDPNVIPLGSKVYVSGYGIAIAADTGGVINGNIIDVYLNSEADCIAWGRKTVTVEILALPGEW